MANEEYNLSGLFLQRALEEARTNIDEPGINAKYTDALLLSKLQQAYTMVLGELRRNAQSPVVASFPVLIQQGVTEYPLPYHMAAVYAVFEDSPSGIRVFWNSRSRLNPGGPGVRVEGATLMVPSGFLSDGTVLTVEYAPGGAAGFHIGRLTYDSFSEDRLQVTLPGQSDLLLGTLDTRRHAYVGSLIRIVGGDGYSAMEEHLIAGYDRDTRVAVLQTAVAEAAIPNEMGSESSSEADDEFCLYEIAPMVYVGLDHVVGLYVARWIAGIEGHTSRARELARMYADGMRVVRLNAFYSRVDEASKLRTDTHDRRRFMRRG